MGVVKTVTENRHFTVIPCRKQRLEFDTEKAKIIDISLIKLLNIQKALAIVRTPDGKPHGDFFNICRNLVRDDAGEIVLFKYNGKLHDDSCGDWFGVALGMDDLELGQPKGAKLFRFGLVEVDLKGFSENQIGLKILKENITFEN